MKTKRSQRGSGISPSLYTLLLLLLIAGGFALLGGCRDERPAYCQGYYEGDYVYVAAPSGGRLLQLLVEKGSNAVAGQVLFVLDPEPEAALVLQSEALLGQARAQWQDSLKGLRTNEVAALRAVLAQREAQSEMSGINARRISDLHKDHMVSDNDYDQARYAHESDMQAVEQARANLEQALLGARDDQIQALAEKVSAQESALKTAQWNLSQKTQTAPVAGMVYDTYYRVGEWVPAGQPVASLLPPENIKVRFYVQEEALKHLQIGQVVQVQDGGQQTLHPARVSYISPSPEYTPPVIFSRDTNAKLVFMVEARPEQASLSTMPPGQPVNVHVDAP